MSSSKLPERASLEYLKKLAKDRLQEMRRTDPEAQLATALLAVARDHGFPSWRALKSELERRRGSNAARFVEACATGDVAAVRELLAKEPELVRAEQPDAPHRGWTGLHAAARGGRHDVVRLLLEHGADPRAREAGDNTTALHWAAASGDAATVRALLDAGADVHGVGDVHEMDAIGWATEWGATDDISHDVVALLLERGARHHIYSAIASGDLALIRRLVEENPDALDRRMSRFERAQTPLHYAMTRKRHDVLALLIGLGADLEATDLWGRTALATAMLAGDQEAMRLLHAAGATPPAPEAPHSSGGGLSALAGSVRKGVTMIAVADVARSLAWYTSLGFREVTRYADGGVVNFGMLSLGAAELMLRPGGTPGAHDVSLWFYTDRIDEIYRRLKSRQLESARSALSGASGDGGIAFEEDLYEPFYGGKQFSVRDVDGYVLVFLEPG
jgi:ankyrin repeat protein/catechol 2,3-dioxygenase-like lactoylglutathione lyase family enzyme